MSLIKRSLPITITAIVVVGGITAYALHLGHNSALLTLAFTLIGGLAGYQVAKS
ncbi:hypothetical protein ES705_44829 [subsurface metagenome]